MVGAHHRVLRGTFQFHSEPREPFSKTSGNRKKMDPVFEKKVGCKNGKGINPWKSTILEKQPLVAPPGCNPWKVG